MIATERYQQRVGSGMRRNQRVLVSDYGLIQVQGDSEWLGFREVLAVDGKPVTDSARRLAELLAKPSPRALQQAKRIAEESARYNIGPDRAHHQRSGGRARAPRRAPQPSHALFQRRRKHYQRRARMGTQISGNRRPDDHPDTRPQRPPGARPRVGRSSDRSDSASRGGHRAWLRGDGHAST